MKKIFCFLTFLFLFSISQAQSSQTSTLSGTVRDPQQVMIPQARVVLLSGQRSVIAFTKTDSSGRFEFKDAPPGAYTLRVEAGGMEEYQQAVNLQAGRSIHLDIQVFARPWEEQISVTANPGLVEEVDSIPQAVNTVNEEEIALRTRTVLAQIANEEPGLNLQRTSPTIAGVFVRGLTGNKVNVFIDGIRYSNSAARGGINTFLGLVDPSYLDSAEILRGPNSAQYGSDAIGGSVQLLSHNPELSFEGTQIKASLSAYGYTADQGFGTTFRTSYSTERFALFLAANGKQVNELRPGKGIDSRNAVTRFFDLPSNRFFGDRLPDTGFTQYGGMIKALWALDSQSQIITGYIRGQQDDGKRYDQLIGGDGNLIADLRNLMLDLFYVKYDRSDAGWFDHLTLSYSLNSQREERVNQGGNGNPLASINHEYERTTVHGIQGNVTKLLGLNQSFSLGAEYYDEGIDSPSFREDPTTGMTFVRRGRIPDNASFRHGGIYLEHTHDVIPEDLRIFSNLRYSIAKYQAQSEDSPLVNGKPLWPDDRLTVDSWTFRFGVLFKPAADLYLFGNFSRGFRAPHMTDLGTLGLTGAGFEVAAPDVAGRGATLGDSASSTAISTGIPVKQLQPETSLSYEVGTRYEGKRVETEFNFFINDIYDSITKQALILPPGAVGTFLGDQVITAQTPAGVVFVAASSNPVLVRANFDDARIWGMEHKFHYRIHPQWELATLFTYLHAADKRTGLPPNIEGGTPAPNGYVKIRYRPSHRKFWAEPYVRFALGQDRLSSLDLEDRRTGATRTRSSISNFFNNGARARGLIGPGADGIPGTSDDVLIATGETLDQILRRVLGPDLSSDPLFDELPAYALLNFRFGFLLGKKHQFILEIENLTDKNYRDISWGLDGPGRSIYLRYEIDF